MLRIMPPQVPRASLIKPAATVSYRDGTCACCRASTRCCFVVRPGDRARALGWFCASAVHRFHGDRDDLVAMFERADRGGEAVFVARLDEDRHASDPRRIDTLLIVVVDVELRDPALQLFELADQRAQRAMPPLVLDAHLAVHATEPHEQTRLGEMEAHEDDERHDGRRDERYVDPGAGGDADCCADPQG